MATTPAAGKTDEKFVKALEEILISKCINPNCDNNGSIPEQVAEDEWVQAQCEYCFTVRFPLIEAVRKVYKDAGYAKVEKTGYRDESGTKYVQYTVTYPDGTGEYFRVPKDLKN